MSVITTSYAVPGPSFQAAIVKLAVSPALIGLLAAVLAMVTSGHSTTRDESSEPVPPL